MITSLDEMILWIDLIAMLLCLLFLMYSIVINGQ